MLLLGYDLETTGLDPAVDVITEVGMALWDTEAKTIVRMMNFLVQTPDNPTWNEQVLALSDITPEVCATHGYDSERGLKQFLLWYQSADITVAHNGRSFDIKFIASWAEKHGYALPEKPMIDTLVDLESQLNPRFSKKLPYLAADHGFLNPFPHRALFDVVTMLKILSQYDLDEAILMANTPSVQLIAEVSFDQKDLAKARGFYWKEASLAKEAGFTVRVA
jgi:DNA polymerase-3 subunit epsilon